MHLLHSFKRHFRYKAAEGLLSRGGLRLLDYACDAAMASPGQPINLWKHVRRGCLGFMVWFFCLGLSINLCELIRGK
jgi:hypothetical protein